MMQGEGSMSNMISKSQCKGCRHWRNLGQSYNDKACHYILDKNKSPIRRDGVCYSREKKQKYI